MNFHEHFQLEISSKCDIKAENSQPTLCKFYEGRKGLRPMGSNAASRVCASDREHTAINEVVGKNTKTL